MGRFAGSATPESDMLSRWSSGFRAIGSGSARRSLCDRCHGRLLLLHRPIRRDVVFWAEWSWEPPLHASHLTVNFVLGSAQRGSDFFPTILAAALINATNWNDFVFFYVSAAFMLVTLLLDIVRVFWDDILRSPGWWIPVPFVVLTLAQYQDTLWAFQIAWTRRCSLRLVGALVLLRPIATVDAPRWGWPLPWAVVASYSSLQGLLVWPAGLMSSSRHGGRRDVRSSCGRRRGSSPFPSTSWASISVVRAAIGAAPPDTRQSAHWSHTGPPHLARQRDSHSYCWDLGRPTRRGDRGPPVRSPSVIVARAPGGGKAARPGRRRSAWPSIVLTLAFDVLLVPARIVGSVTSGDRLPVRHLQLATGGRRLRCMPFCWARDVRRHARPVRFASRFAGPLGRRSDRGGVVRGRRARENRPHGPQHELPISWRTIGRLPLSLAAPYVWPDLRSTATVIAVLLAE